MISNKQILKTLSNIQSNINHKNTIIVLSIILILSLIYMTYTLYSNEQIYINNVPRTTFTESFSNKNKKNLKVKDKYSSKKLKEKLKKLKMKKKDPFDTDIDFSHYGTTEFKKQLPKSKSSKLLKLKLQNNPEYKNTKPRAIDEDNITSSNDTVTNTKTTKSHKKSHKTKEDFNDTFTLLKEIDSEANPGKYDRFQNILDEVDKIDTNSFSFTSMNDALRAYNDNINNRMKYAKKQSTSNFDGTMAQGSILIDELKKLFSYDSYFN